jgi:hypothetical protein
MKITDKAANLRDGALHPPADCTRVRRHEYATMAMRVVDNLEAINRDFVYILGECNAGDTDHCFDSVS